MHMKFNRVSFQFGLSLIELVIFIVILSVALTSITLVYLNTTRQSADPLIRIKSVELAQTTLNEILLKGFDENSPLGGGCVEFGSNSNCPAPGTPNAVVTVINDALNPEEGAATPANPELRGAFDDVDDYHNLAYCGTNGVPDPLCTNPCIDLVDETGSSIKNEYPGFAVCIRVSFAGAEINGFTGDASDTVEANDAKRIDVVVTDPVKSKISLSAYSLNY